MNHIGNVSSDSGIKVVAKQPVLEPPPKYNTSTFDPSGRKSVRSEAHKMLDVSLDFLRRVRDRSAWLPLLSEVQHCILCETLPEPEKHMGDVFQDVMDDVLPYSGGNTHLRIWSWVPGSGTVGGTSD